MILRTMAIALAMVPFAADAADHHGGGKKHKHEHAADNGPHVGTWTLAGSPAAITFTPGGHSITVDKTTGIALTLDHYKREGDRFTIYQVDGALEFCRGQKGVYDMVVDGDSAVVTKISDECESRGSNEPVTLTRVPMPEMPTP